VLAKIGLIGFIYLAVLVLTRELTAADLGMGRAPRASAEPGSEL
jgi:hypothetical protein